MRSSDNATIAEPDAAALGGRLLSKHANRRVVFLPYGIAKQLRRHEAVAFVQRIWTGEPASEWDEPESDAASVRPGAPSSNADPTFTWDKSYQYDADGNIVEIGADRFGYDAMGRLTSATVDGHSQSYTYDGFGNLTEIAPAGGTPVTIPADPSTNRLMGHLYDAAGNVTSRKDGTYVYDSLNMVAEVRLTPGSPRRILYDADEERIGTLLDGLERWTLRGLDGQILREYTSWMELQNEWVWEQDHIRGEGQLIAGETMTWRYDTATSQFSYGGKRHYHLDHLGSVRVVTNQAGLAISENDFSPFGKAINRQYQEQINHGNPHTDGMRFAGHWRDFMGYPGVEDDIYLDYMHARYYDPNAGRFLSVDPGRDWDPKLPQSWNLYTYVRNNPVLLIDPDGRAILLKSKNGVRLGTDADGDGEADELQDSDPEGTWFAIVFGENGVARHEALVLVTPDGKPTKVWENAAGFPKPREGVDWAQSFVGKDNPAWTPLWAKNMGSRFDPTRHTYDHSLNSLFVNNRYQCTNYCRWKQAGQPPSLLLKTEWLQFVYGIPALADRNPDLSVFRASFMNIGYRHASSILRWNP